MQEMHRYTQETEDLARALEDYARARIADLPPLDRPASPEELSAFTTAVEAGSAEDNILADW